MVKRREAEGLAECVTAQIGLQAERVDSRHERANCEERAARHGRVLGDVSASLGEHRVDGGDTVGGRERLHLHRPSLITHGVAALLHHMLSNMLLTRFPFLHPVRKKQISTWKNQK